VGGTAFSHFPVSEGATAIQRSIIAERLFAACSACARQKGTSYAVTIALGD
jgi:hypothetical protein